MASPQPDSVPLVRTQSQLPVEDPEDDALEYRHYAEMLAIVVDAHATPTPMTLAVTGSWGLGKTSLLGLVESELESKPSSLGASNHAIVRFDAWLHNDKPNIKAALVQEIVASTNHLRNPIDRWLRPVRGGIYGAPTRVRVVKYGLLVAFALLLGAWSHAADQPESGGWSALGQVFLHPSYWTALPVWLATTKYGGLILLASTGLPLWNAYRAFRDPLGHVQAVTSARDSPWSIQNMRASLHDYIHQVTRGRRLVLLVDNVDRCTQANAYAILESMDQLLQAPRTIILAAVDVERLERLLIHEPNARLEKGDGRAYLQKVFHGQFDIPPFPGKDLPEALRGHLREEEEKIESPSPTSSEFLAGVWDRACNPLSSNWTHPNKLDPSSRKVSVPAGLLGMGLAVQDEMTHEARDNAYPSSARSNGWGTATPRWSMVLPRSSRDWICHAIWWFIVLVGYWRAPSSLMVAVILAWVLAYMILPTRFMRRMYAKDQRALNDYREEVEEHLRDGKSLTKLNREAREKLPERLHVRLKALAMAARVSLSLQDDPVIRLEQARLLRSVEMTPRECKRWTTRIRFAIAIASRRQFLHSDVTVPQIVAWTLLAERGEAGLPEAVVQEIRTNVGPAMERLRSMTSLNVQLLTPQAVMPSKVL